MELKSLIPWRHKAVTPRGEGDTVFDRFHQEMKGLFDDFFAREPFSPGAIDFFRGSDIIPKINVSDGEKEVKITAELPGMDEKDLEVNLHNNQLTISGERKHEEEVKEENRYYFESSYGKVYRSIPLPTEVDSEKIDAKFKKGVLTIKLPKTKPTVPKKKITIRAE